jgi:hypothetical protein
MLKQVKVGDKVRFDADRVNGHFQRLGDVLAELGEPDRTAAGQAVGPGITIRSRGKCAGNGWRAGFRRVNTRTCVVAAAAFSAATSSSVAAASSSSSAG